MILKSPAKINLFLNIINKRRDCYHDIQTYFQFISLFDIIKLKIIPGSKILFSSNSKFLSENDNLCVKAANLIRKNFKSKEKLSVSIELLKNIPLGGGLGGGSSNAASVLIGLNRLWNCGLKKDDLFNLALELGSDVPFFVNGRSAFGEGVGNLLTDFSLRKKFYLITNPGIHVSSELMYKKYIINDCINSINLNNMHEYIGFNSFESLLCDLYPEIKYLLNILRKNYNGSVSGSGSCLFSIFDTEKDAIYASSVIPDKYKTYIVHSISKI